MEKTQLRLRNSIQRPEDSWIICSVTSTRFSSKVIVVAVNFNLGKVEVEGAKLVKVRVVIIKFRPLIFQAKLIFS